MQIPSKPKALRVTGFFQLLLRRLFSFQVETSCHLFSHITVRRFLFVDK
uniref:Uncharacterized protein n=1 Tax=Zea mays TaxID=4577 RepID=B7ZZ83_MAIZE|nr:unknown [Zea mays]